MSDINDLVLHAVDKNPVEFSNSFNELLHGRIVDAINDRRVDIAQSLYSETEGADAGEDA